ncbi:MAG: nuclear transport factor 2 family protein [Anaerolineales bacterium]|nr:nuclear transport factor 2 family protein [Anaerolineales bacterium]
MTLKGKGFFIWQIARCENGDVEAVADLAEQSGLSHILVKIADGAYPYNIVNDIDLVPPLVQALRDRLISVWGWHYVYGYEPQAEAQIAIQRLNELGLDGYVIDAEAQYKEPGKEEAALIFMAALRAALPDFPIALSSYRYPTYHPTLPWVEFLQSCDLNMPQVYWIGAHNPAEQLARSLREFEAITPFRPLIPTGAAFIEGGWQPTVAEVLEFLQAARDLNMTAANFWEWYNCRKNLPDIWNAIRDFPWPFDDSDLDIVLRYMAALNSHDVERVLALYNDNAVHVLSSRTLQGTDQLRWWYNDLFTRVLPEASFTLIESQGEASTRHFTWSAISSRGQVENGADSFGLVGEKITYHYSHFSVTSP